MNILLNGKPYETLCQTVSALLRELDLADKPVVVEQNKLALFPRDYDTVKLHDGDTLEVITIAAGG